MHPYPRPFSALTNYDVGNTNSKINYELVKVGYIKNPNRNKNTIIGASHHFFLSDKKSQNSFKIDSLDISFLF